MAIQQMICFVTPDAPPQVPRSVTRRIDAMCTAIGRIHFATLALLPPAPGASALAPGSLMLEIVVDEDLLLPDLVDLMLDHAFGALWQVYKGGWSGPPQADPGTKRTWLKAFLLDHAYVADGGFVGARDRSVAQVLAEDELFRAARKDLHALPTAERPGDARALGERMARWARDKGFKWVAGPAPRSRWRKGPGFGAADWVSLMVRLVVPVFALLGFLYALGWATLFSADLLHGMGLSMPRELSSAVVLAGITIVLALVPLLAALLTGSGIVALAGLFAGYAVVAVWILVSGTFKAIGEGNLLWPTCSTNQGLLGFLGVLAFALSAAMVALVPVLLKLRAPPFFPWLATGVAILVLLVLSWASSQLMFGAMEAYRSCNGQPAQWQLVRDASTSARLAWSLVALLLVVGVSGLILVFATRLGPWLLRRSDSLNRPGPLPPLPAHQVHPSIQECEAALAAKTSHMISLTEIRRPYWLFRWVLRFWLWFFSVLGDLVFTEGVLGRAHGIKFGHWHIIDDGRRLLFCSNFDSAFGGYLDEFIQGATEGVNLIWRNSELRPREAAREDQPTVELARSFPPTRLGIFRGCKAEQAFKAYTRASMLPHLHRFEAYTLSNQDIERATRLHEALRGTRTALKDDQIARALES
ncbi:hypothetical protein [Variovorax sp. OV329]|uniref:hypothetical protein n=1 Tax=Variovorax sp. OV329 TaxID=1882825 RepID=UPI0008E79269|nr:hypothetical protein [Variovorax sp. OV329]SFM33570.1 Uncharacterized membrane protein [Variovorax sp. OV329]